MQSVRKAMLAAAVWGLGAAGPLTAQGPADLELVDPSVDHVLMTLPTAVFADLSVFLESEFGESWFLVPDSSKGFFRFRDGRTYVEIFNAGAKQPLPLLGYQIAIASSDTEDGKRKAVAYYGHQGVQRDFFFTVGANHNAGNTVGGTFFVSYESPPSTTVDDTPVSALASVVTTMPEFRMAEVETYRTFGFSTTTRPGGVVVRDASGLVLCFLERQNEDLPSLGHVALRFRLVEPIGERREVEIVSAGTMKAVFEGDYVWLAFRPDVVDVASLAAGC
jgi:hypothetical protein